MDGKLVYQIRTVLGLDQDQFAKAINLKGNTVYKIETGRRKATPRLFEYLSLKYPRQYAKALRIWRKRGKSRKQNH